MRAPRSILATLFATAAFAAGACSDSGTEPPPNGGGAGVTISPRETTVDVGSTTTLTASATDARGNALPSSQIFWSSEDTALAVVNAQGVVTAKKPGTVRIAASVAGVNDLATVTIRPQPVARVNVSQASAQILVGQTVRLTASPVNSAGQPLTDRTVTWRSSSDAIARVDTAGLVTGIAPGAAIVTATSGTASTQVAITVSAIPVASITLAPTSASLAVGQTTQLSATALDAAGAPLRDRPILFASSNDGIATVSSAGLVLARAAGSATITASAEGKSATATVTVSPVPASAVIVSPNTPQILVGQSTALSAQVTDASGNVLSGRTVTFTSDNPGIASVTSTGATSANVTGVTAGTTTIRATSEGKTGTATVTVRPVPVASVSISPSAPTLIVGAQTTLTATAKDASGNTLSNRPFTWSTNNPAVATVSGGVVTAVGPGTAIISATAEGVVGQATVTVTPVPVASVTVSPPSSSLVVGATAQLSYTLRDASNNILTGRQVTWSSSDNRVALVSSGGLVTAVGVGSATITATSEGRSGSATVTVSQVPVASVSVSPATAAILVGQSTTLQATVTTTAGQVVTDRAVTWSSSNETVARVSSTGVVTAAVTGVAAGTATITASSEGRTGSATITVGSPAAVATVSVTPVNPSMKMDTNLTLTATCLDAAGNALSGQAITWSKDVGDSIATLSASGSTAVLRPKRGDTTVRVSASCGGKTGSTTVTVTN